MKKIIPISHLVIGGHAKNPVSPVGVQQMMERGLDFWEELDHNMTRLVSEYLNDKEQQDNNVKG